MIVAISAVYWDEALILILSPSKTVKIKSKTKLHFYFHLLCALDWGEIFHSDIYQVHCGNCGSIFVLFVRSEALNPVGGLNWLAALLVLASFGYWSNMARSAWMHSGQMSPKGCRVISNEKTRGAASHCPWAGARQRWFAHRWKCGALCLPTWPWHLWTPREWGMVVNWPKSRQGGREQHVLRDMMRHAPCLVFTLSALRHRRLITFFSFSFVHGTCLNITCITSKCNLQKSKEEEQ